MRRVTTLIKVILLTLTVVACENVPQPFQGAERNDSILDAIMINPAVMIAPIIGAPPPINQDLAAQIAKATQDRDVAAVTRGAGKSASLLQGQVDTVNRADGSTWLQFTWTLTGTDGIVIDTLTTEVEAFSDTADDPWLVFANTDLSPTIYDVARFLESWLFRPTELAAIPDISPEVPQIEGTYHLYIDPIQGAPGDGDTALTKAMTRLLNPDNLLIPVVLDTQPSAVTYIIAGQVTKDVLNDAQEIIRLEWSLRDPNGAVLGTVTQENEIARGSLDQRWDETALFAVEGAAEGLLPLLIQFPALGTDFPANSTSPPTLRGPLN